MIAHPVPKSAPMSRPTPLAVIVVIVVLCFQAGYGPQDLQRVLISVAAVLAATSVVCAGRWG